MQPIENQMHEIRRRFALGLLRGMKPNELRAFVTGACLDQDED